MNRALCEVDADGNVTGIVEGAVQIGDGHTDPEFAWRPIGAPEADARVMKGDEPVSMNLWGFTPAILPVLHDAFAGFSAGRAHRRRGRALPAQRRRRAPALGRAAISW